ncbi:MAG TPA: 2-oxoglutarate dehydrogenase E1 component [Stellaceae bacterium]|nr:2-oxoglutarate dehydrogenase E1 component [Stellaceae bacterium]
MAQSLEASFLNSANTAFLAELYAHWLDDPSSIDPSWASLFGELQDDAQSVLAELAGPTWRREATPRIIGNGKAANGNGAAIASGDVRRAALDSICALQLIRSYRVRGHLMAELDPLGLRLPESHCELDPRTYGFTEADYDRPIYIHNVLGLEAAPLREIVELLRQTYCGHVGVEFMHIQDPDQKSWIQQRIEQARNQTEFTARGKRAILERLTEAEGFEKFLDKRFTGTKRFGLEGAETLIPALEQILKRGSQLGVKEFVLGMAHRGRLNVLANVIGKPYVAIFSEFQGVSANPEDVQGSGDVKYHLGTSSDREFDGQTVHLSLTANPSHLEAVNPVVLGKVRAKQRQRGDEAREQVVGLLLHGDAAMAGQGSVAETFELSQLKGYRTGGTVHVVINNQIGFTTAPAYARSGVYCTDVAKMVQAPIFHVNGDDPEATVHVCRVAMEFRQEFKTDVVVDMFCYRRHGHNETDEPAFTQPLMYRKIAALPTTREIYARRLADEGVVSDEQGWQIEADFVQRLDQAYEAAKSYRPNKADWLEGAWAGFEGGTHAMPEPETGVADARLKSVGKALTTIPEGFNLNRKIARQLTEKSAMFESGIGFDWGTCEALALGTLAAEGVRVRMSGQDVERGTFSHRHAVLIDQETEEAYMPLGNVADGQAHVAIFDSPLSEAGVLGFDYGYSLADPQTLVLWEAQFGDFANGAQVIIDQFVASSEVKWLRMSGIVLLLPHGYEGQGPEHSSARLERYLQLCAEDNLQVCNLSTPANYFHALRRQMHRPYRKPLIIMSPKSMLRSKLSTLAEMDEGTSFRPVIGEPGTRTADRRVRRVVLCSGKIYHELYAQRAERKIEDVALVRLEQLYPFPAGMLSAELLRYGNAEVVWCQEEPENGGAWHFVDRRIEGVLARLPNKIKRPRYAGRPEAAATATGSMKRHVKEQAAVIGAALD